MSLHDLSIDLETYSSVPIADAGASAYVRSPDFEILLFAYSIDRAPVQIVDLAQGEPLPSRLIGALTDPYFTKHAYNAAFEWGCLSQYLHTPLPPEQWRDTMLQGLYAGYTAGLAATGNALGLPEDKKKLQTGKALIRYFCIPCKPTKTNGGRTRNLPKHDPDKWALFKEYCCQDVVTEMEIADRLAAFPVPNTVQKQWETDLIINDRGVAVDMDMVHGALAIGDKVRTVLMEEATQLTRLGNPNSVIQLTNWVEAQIGKGIDGLTKETVAALLGEEQPPDVQRVLQIRQELGKTSTKKYDAIQVAVCPDGRVRGLLQFYGASRSGRWAGRLVQVQNLPRTYIQELDAARELVKAEDVEGIRFAYGSPSNTLSQLIRTAFIAGPGKVLIDADFSAIEARVISWLAGERWRLEVFRNGGDIYCASASQMFKCNVVKGGENGHLRQKGKVAELALGYQGGTGALISMGALEMGLSEEELPDIVSRWRKANGKIQDLWYKMDAAARKVVQQGATENVNGLILAREFDKAQGHAVLSILLPAGRKLYYVEPRIGTNKYGNESLVYSGQDQKTHKWATIETFGGKLVENCVQAIARDCLAWAIERLTAAGYPIVFHVHDEVVIEIEPYDTPEKMLEDVVRIMSEPISWAPGLPLDADGWVGDYFRKD